MGGPVALHTKVVGLIGVVLAACFAVFSIAAQTTAPVAATSPSKEWRDYAGSPEGNRYIDFNQITKANVPKLEVAWTYPYAATATNAIVADGVIYTKARTDALVALDAAT